jgi:hypothetical protein
MRATVLQYTVASLIVMSPAPAVGSAMTVTFAAPQAQESAFATDTLRLGGREVAAGDSVRGPVLVAAGDLRVSGTVVGTAVSLLGDIVVEEGGLITGDAVAVLGSVRGDPAAIGGSVRSFTGSFSWLSDVRSEPVPRRNTADALSLSFGWLVMILLIGIGVLVFAGGYLDGVTDVLEQSFWRSFLVGIAAELGLVPVLVLVVAALAITLVGILLIPFAIVAYVLAVAGLVTLGFLAVAQLVGGSFGRKPATAQPRGQALRALVFGVVLFMGSWVVAAAFQWWPFLAGLLRMVAFAITFVAATAGLGAAVLSRGGTHRDAAAPEPQEPTNQAPVWQTPTPVTGVAAARRPVKAS